MNFCSTYKECADGNILISTALIIVQIALPFYGNVLAFNTLCLTGTFSRKDAREGAQRGKAFLKIRNANLHSFSNK